jgi:hypothetical protein
MFFSNIKVLKIISLLSLTLPVVFALISCESRSIQQYKQNPDNPAYIILCPKNILGCANKININKTDYLISSENDETKKKIEDLEQKKQEEFVSIPIIELNYKTTKETGHFPNPMAEFEVIKIEKISF